MEFARLLTIDNQKLHIDSVGVLPRKVVASSSSATGSGAQPVTPMAPEMTLGSKEELQLLLYIGTSDGCITQFTSTVQYTEEQGAPQYTCTATQTQKRQIFEGVEGSVPFLAVDDKLREPRVLVMCNGKVAMLHYNSLDPLPVFASVKSLDGATACCIAQGQSDGRRLAAVVKKQLVLLEYSESSCSPFVGAGQPLTLPDSIIQIAWHHNVIICGSKREYVIYDVRTNHLVDQVVLDKMALGPAIRYLPTYGGTGVMALRYGDSVVLYDGKHRAPIDPNNKVVMSEPIVDVNHCHPYLIGFKSDGRVIVLSTVDNEEIPTNSPNFGFGTLCRSHSAAPLALFGVTNLTLGVLVTIPPVATVSRFVQFGFYERAIRHYEYTFGGAEERYFQGLRKIRHSCAVHAFLNRRFATAFEYFELADTPPSAVASAVRELQRASGVAASATAAGVFAVPAVSMEGDSDAYLMMYQFLRKKRSPPVDASFATEEQRTVDHAIFLMLLWKKVEYVEEDVNELFLPTSALVVDECLPLVQQAEAKVGARPAFLSLLLASSGRFKEALEQCRSLQLVAEAIVPLQLAGEKNLYIENLPWMLQANPTVAIRALTWTSTSGHAATSTPNGSHSVKAPPDIDVILPLVFPYSGSTLTDYLEFVIYQQRCKDSLVHTVHALNLIDTIRELRQYRVAGFEDSSVLRLPPGEETGLLGETRTKLLQFLSTSGSRYDVDVIIDNLLKVGRLDDELVAAYRASGEHEAALQILVFRLRDTVAAEQYCLDLHEGKSYRWKRGVIAGEEVTTTSGPVVTDSREDQATSGSVLNCSFTSDNSSDFDAAKRVGSFDGSNSAAVSAATGTCYQPPRAFGGGGSAISSENESFTIRSRDGGLRKFNDYFNTLLRVFLVPPKGEQQRVEAALRLLEAHSESINPLSVISTLPGDVALSEISTYLMATLRSNAHKKLIASFAVQCAKSESTSASRYKSLLTQRCVYIDDQRPCVVCKKKVGDAVFGVFPNLKVAHFRCFKERDVDPERGTPFVPAV